MCQSRPTADIPHQLGQLQSHRNRSVRLSSLSFPLPDKNTIRVTPPHDPQPVPSTSAAPATATADSPGRRRGRHHEPATSAVDQAARQIHQHDVHPHSISAMAVDTLVPAHNTFSYPVYTTPLHAQPPRGMPSAPPQTWQDPSIAPQQTHLAPMPHIIPRPPFREEWEGYDHTAAHVATDGMAGPATNGYDYRYREDQHGWVAPYYDPSVNFVLWCGSGVVVLIRCSFSMSKRMILSTSRTRTVLQLVLPRRLLLNPSRQKRREAESVHAHR